MNTEELKAIAEWFVSRDTGISSETMAAIHLGAEKGRFNPPLDPFQVNDCQPAFAQKGMDFNSWLNLRSYLRMQIADFRYQVRRKAPSFRAGRMSKHSHKEHNIDG